MYIPFSQGEFKPFYVPRVKDVSYVGGFLHNHVRQTTTYRAQFYYRI